MYEHASFRRPQSIEIFYGISSLAVPTEDSNMQFYQGMSIKTAPELVRNMPTTLKINYIILK